MGYAIIDPYTNRRVNTGQQSILLVRCPNIFSGYYGDKSGEGFYSFEDKRWHHTSDFVIEDAEGVLTFCDRKKRFIKLSSKIISLTAIENSLLPLSVGGSNGFRLVA